MGILKRIASWIFRRIFSWLFVKFGIVGAVGVFVNYAVYWLLRSIIGANYLLCSVIATEIAILNNFVLNDIWTFKERRAGTSLIKRLLNFHWSRLLGLFVTVGSLYLMVDFAGLNEYVSYIFAIGVGTLTNFFTSDVYVWPKRRLEAKQASS